MSNLRQDVGDKNGDERTGKASNDVIPVKGHGVRPNLSFVQEGR